MAIFTEETQKKILATMQETNALTKIIANGWNVDSWKAVQAIVQAGAGAKYFPVGTQFAVQASGWINRTCIFDVVAHDKNKNPNDASAHTMTLLSHNTLWYATIDNRELLWVNTTGAELAAGTYNLTLDHAASNQGTGEDGTYQFTTTKAIPANGGFFHTQIGRWHDRFAPEVITGGTFTTYDADGNVLESDLACTQGAGGTHLGTTGYSAQYIVNTVGTFNSAIRNGFGSSNWKDSGCRQWMNSSDATFAWQKQHMFDMKFTLDNGKTDSGLLSLFPSDFTEVLGEVDNITARNTAFEVDGNPGGYDVTRDKLFLPSLLEVGLTPLSGTPVDEGCTWDYYVGAVDADRIKTLADYPNVGRPWFLRSCGYNLSYTERNASVTTTGTMGAQRSSEGMDFVIACVIY